MVKNVYSVYDRKMKYYVRPVVIPNDDEARRSFSGVFSGENDISKFPQDYRIDYLGKFDDSTGEFIPQIPPTLFCELTELNYRGVNFNEEKPISS